MKKIILVMVLLMMGGGVLAQADKDYYEKETYRLFLKKDWKSAIEKCEEAIDKDIDYYYMRMRLGIAYYELQNYMQAIKHFEKALKFNPGDKYALEYLYYANKFSGRTEEADLTAENFPAGLKTETGYKPPAFMHGIYTEGGYTFNSNYSNQERTDLTGDADIYGEQKLLKGYSYFNIALLHKAGSRFSITHGYTNLNINYTKLIYEQIEGNKDFDISTSQNEYYILANYYAGSGFNLMVSYHYLNVNINDKELEYRRIQGNNQPFFNETELKRSESIFGVHLSKYAGNFKFLYSGSYSELNFQNQIQNGLSLIYFPFGNLNLYFVSDLVLHSQKPEGTGKGKKFLHNLIYTQKAGVKLSNHLWLEGYFTAGRMENYNEGLGYVVYNNFEPITRRFAFNLISPINDKIELSLLYQNIIQDNSNLIYTSTTQYTTLKNNNINHSIIGGLKWTF